VLPQTEATLWIAERQAVKSIAGRTLGQVLPRTAVTRDFDVIVMETWFPRRQNGSMDWIESDPLLTARHIGAIEAIAALSGTEVKWMNPSDKHVHVASQPEEWEALDLESREQHDKDARQHLWGYFFRNWFTGSMPTADTLRL
jgi:hypothetical protein